MTEGKDGAHTKIVEQAVKRTPPTREDKLLDRPEMKIALVGTLVIGAVLGLAGLVTLPSGDKARPAEIEGMMGDEVKLIKGVLTVGDDTIIRTSRELPKNGTNIVRWGSIETRDGSLEGVEEIGIENAIITKGVNPDKHIPGEEFLQGDWISFPDKYDRWLTLSFSNSTAGSVYPKGNIEIISGSKTETGGFLFEDNSTTIEPQDVAVVTIIDSD